MKFSFALGCVLLFACTAPTRSTAPEGQAKERQSYSIYGPNIGQSSGPASGATIKDTGKTEFDEEEEQTEEEQEEETDVNSCDGLVDDLVEPACATCVEGSCCAQTAACANDTTCWNDCLLNFDETKCAGTGASLYQALGTCLQNGCAAECFPEEEEEETPPLSCDAPVIAPSAGSCFTIDQTNNLCNPVSNEGCTEEGSVCDGGETGFECYPPPNDVVLCQACGETEGFCGAGMACFGGQCARYCCDDNDCGTGTCDKTITGIEVGLCLAPAP